MNIGQMKRVQVGYLDTPLELMPRLSKELGQGLLYIKRDDLTGTALGGNKTRKLDYLVQYALDNGYTALLTFGGAQTNHGRLTVAAAIRHGLRPILVLKDPKPDYCSGNLILDRLMGADIHFVDMTAADSLPEPERAREKERFLEKCTREIIGEYRARGEKVLSVPVGGQGMVGSAGYIQAVPELMRQMQEQGVRARYLVAGYGSTGTFAGLWAGAKYYNAPFEVIGIPIEPDYRSVEETAAFINELSGYYQMGFRCTPGDIRLESGPADAPYGGLGYNVPDPVTMEYIGLLARTEGIFTDPCYTGKVFHGFVDLIRRGKIPYGENAIFLHTGGSPGLWSKEHLDALQDMYWKDSGEAEVMRLEL